MIFPVLGLKAPLTRWCQRAVSELATRAHGETPEINADSAGDLLRGLLSSRAMAVATSSRPDRLIREALLKSGRNFVVAAATPRGSGEFLIRREVAPLDAAREVLADLASLFAVARSDSAILVSQDDAVNDPSGTVLRIARHLGLSCEKEDAVAISDLVARELADNGLGQPLSEMDREDQAALAGALDDLSLATGRFDRVVATRRFFKVADSDKPPLEPIDATGRNRLLIVGPFISLPEGDWTARCMFSFSPGLIGTPMTVDVVHFVDGFHELARTTFVVTSAGRFDIDIRFKHSEPSAALEVRLFSDKAVFDGTVSLGYVEFRRSLAETDADDAPLAVPGLA